MTPHKTNEIEKANIAQLLYLATSSESVPLAILIDSTALYEIAAK